MLRPPRRTLSVVIVAPESISATRPPGGTVSWSAMRPNAFSIANASTSMTLGVRPPACSTEARISTFSAREAASSTSTDSVLPGTGPRTSKSRFTSSIGYGM